MNSTLIPLEQAINGVQDMRYISSDATSAGEATIRIIFEPGTDPNLAVVRVKTRVDQVMPLLPELVQREGGDHHSDPAQYADVREPVQYR